MRVCEVEVDELDCAGELELELETVVDEEVCWLAESWPRTAVIFELEEICVLLVLALVLVALTETVDDLVLDCDVEVLDAEFRIHRQALVTWDADRPGTGEFVLVSCAHHVQKGEV